MDNAEDQQKRQLSPLFRRLLKANVWLAEHFRLSGRQIILLLAALIGLLGALASEIFRKASELLHYAATGSRSGIISTFERLPWWERVGIPTIGGLLAGLALW